MLLKLPSGFRIIVPPFFFWELRSEYGLKIHSRQAFHPEHTTTRLCLELLDLDLKSAPCRSLLDVGCGTGILGLAAAALGVPFVAGLDIDERAVRLSRENAARNGAHETTRWFVGTADALRARFDYVVANLRYSVLLEILDSLMALLDEGGRLIVSGFHDIHWHSIRETLVQGGLQVQDFLSADRSFFGIPPSGSFTWIACRAIKGCTGAGDGS